MKVLLTSAGFENPRVAARFLALAGKPAAELRVVFVPTAANNPGAIMMLPKCMNDLLGLGIPGESILVHDLHRRLRPSELRNYDAVYVCGGSTDYLVERINRSGSKGPLLRFIRSGGVYVGVSAGSCAAAGNAKTGLGLLKNVLHVHCEEGDVLGPLDPASAKPLSLTDRRAIVFDGGGAEVIE